MESRFLAKYEKLRRISFLLGNDSDLIQGAGGNTSLKIKNKLWIHCKNLNAFTYFNKINENFNYKWCKP